MRKLAGVCAIAGMFGCSAGGTSLQVGTDETGTGGRTSGPAESGGTTNLPDIDAGQTNALSVHIESPKDVTVEFITVSCSGDCAEVEAVTRGGFPPYDLSWEDGSKNARRQVCPTSTTEYGVSVTDSGRSTGEFQRAPVTVAARLTASVLDCPAPGDAGKVGTGPLCIQNGSLEGTAQANTLLPFATDHWNPCPGGPSVGWVTNEIASTSSATYPVASDGSTYGIVSTNSGFGGAGILAQSLCAPVEPGNQASFTVALARIPFTGPVSAVTAQVQVFGGSAECGETELLWTSPDLTTSFAEFCVTLKPSARVDSISFHPLGDGNPLFNGLMLAAIDHIVPVPSCPTPP